MYLAVIIVSKMHEHIMFYVVLLIYLRKWCALQVCLLHKCIWKFMNFAIFREMQTSERHLQCQYTSIPRLYVGSKHRQALQSRNI